MSVSSSPRPPLRILAIALGAFIMLGLIDGALGVAWPSLRNEFQRGLSDLGALLSFGSVGYLTASGSYGWLHSRLGTGLLLGVGSVLLALGVTGLAVAPVWMLVTVSAVVIGLGGGLVDTGMNAHAALAFDLGSISLLHACYGVGATLGPVVITLSLVSSGAWRVGYAVMAGLQVVTAAAVWSRKTRWEGRQTNLRSEDSLVGSRMQSWVALLLFFLYTGIEVAAGQWAFTLLTEGRGMATAPAGVWVALYWGGLTIGRFGFGIIGDRVSPSSTLNASMVVAMSGLALLWIDPAGLGAIGLPIAGVGFAAVFPTLVSLTPSRIGRVASTRSMGYQLAAANVGAAGVPWLVGIMTENRGLSFLGPALFGIGLLLAIVHLVSDRMTAPQAD